MAGNGANFWASENKQRNLAIFSMTTVALLFCDWLPLMIREWGGYEPFLTRALEKFHTSPTLFSIHTVTCFWRMADEMVEPVKESACRRNQLTVSMHCGCLLG